MELLKPASVSIPYSTVVFSNDLKGSKDQIKLTRYKNRKRKWKEQDSGKSTRSSRARKP